MSREYKKSKTPINIHSKAKPIKQEDNTVSNPKIRRTRQQRKSQYQINTTRDHNSLAQYLLDEKLVNAQIS